MKDRLPGEPAECPLPSWPKPVHEEVGIEGECIVDAQTLHKRECGAVHETEELIGECLGNVPSGLEVGWFYCEDGGPGLPQCFPEDEGGRPRWEIKSAHVSATIKSVVTKGTRPTCSL